ncbi:MAG: hypothetical protein K2X61_00130 [Caulobacteraceae bacterium]|nr:hypothetical protein [Caulobacteraceae bacterium]
MSSRSCLVLSISIEDAVVVIILRFVRIFSVVLELEISDDVSLGGQLQQPTGEG